MLSLLTATLLVAAPPQDLVEYELRIDDTRDAPAGNDARALTLNGGIPGPVLRFTEGDRARITVHNDLEGEPTSIHWHGLLVPNAMDGVPYLTTPRIEPGTSHVFEFTLRQSGTYWYHSHTGLQEQQGVYGVIVIEPREPAPEDASDGDHAVILSDWTNENPLEVMRTLMRGSEWYSIRKGTVQSVLGAWRAGKLGEYFAREKARMPAMDVSDVAYDAFLANGEEEHFIEAQPGDRVRLRLVNAGASSYFHVTSAAGPLTLIAADGIDVRHVDVHRLLMGNAETYDVLVDVPDNGRAVEVRATAMDTSGCASVVLGPAGAEVVRADDPPSPDLYGMDEAVRAGIESQRPDRGMNAATADRPFAPYALLEAREPTTIVVDEDAPVTELELRLTGDMRRYVWGFNGKTLAEDPVIHVSKDEVLRITFINDTMMHHPLHLHGHFFRLLNGKGDTAPRKHTVDVPPMGRRVIEWIADEEPGDWFFHCHLLYHMDAGMARIFSYREQGEDHVPSVDPKLINPTFIFVDGSIQSHMTMGRVMVMRGKDDLVARWDTGLGGDHDDREIDLAWVRYLSPDLSTIAGYRFTNVHGAENRWFLGLRHRLPYMIMAELTFDDEAAARIELEREIMLTNRLSAFGMLQYDTNTYGEWEAGLGWTLSKRFGAVAGYHSDHGAGIGLTFSF